MSRAVTLTPAAAARTTETPNGRMTTLASRTVNGSAHSLWRVDMEGGAAGPSHRSDVQQVLTVLSGAAEVTVDGELLVVRPGDTAVIHAGALRRVAALDRFTMLVSAAPTANAVLPDGTDRGTLPWAA